VTRVGVVDLGTNSTRLLVADVEDGDVRELERRLVITRLGEGVDAGRELQPAAIARVEAVLAGFRPTIEATGVERTLAFATSAVRDAANGAAFLDELEREYGLATRLLTGHEEALLTFRGVSAGRELREPTLVVDVGGGSTELIAGGPRGVVFHTSLDLGCVRLTERFPADRHGAAGHARKTLGESVPDEVRPSIAIGVAGTVTQLATLDLGLEEEVPEIVHGHRLARATIAAQVERLAALPVEEIRALRGMNPYRASVIVAGAVVVRETLAHFDLDELEVSEKDILHGAALAAAEPA
jgi:exopolyphosphatase / guanosine-5'-triphosphate,3'-diphosphate pyrophosphatase